MHQCDIGSFNGDVGAGAAHCDTHLCACHGGGIVDPVSDHCDMFVGRCQLLNVSHLIFRQQLGVTLAQRKFISSRRRCALVVTCQHDGFYATLAQRSQRPC